jgi:AraC-like DNA-binding protein
MQRCNYQKAELISVSNFLLTKQIFYEMLYAWENKRSANYIKSQFYLLLDSLLTEGSKDNVSKAYLRCVEYINNNFTDPAFNIDNLCRNSYVCRSTVQRAFNANLGMSPSQYLTKLRVEKALKTLVSEHMPVSEVALKCGFADEKYFSRVFKKIYGFVPSEARKICFCNKFKKTDS